jgi:shikimate kinase
MGGLVITDNTNMELVDRERMDPSLVALIHVPSYQIRKGGLPLDRIRNIADIIELAYILAQKGQFAMAMKLNGLAYASVLGVDPSIMHEALAKGAVAAGISGTGPATVILIERDRAETLRAEMSGAKDIIQADVYNCD